MPFGGIAKALNEALGSKNLGKLVGDTLDKQVMGQIGKTIQEAMGSGGEVDSVLKKALDGVKKTETQGKELAKVATDAQKKGEEAMGEAVGGMKKIVDAQASLLSNLEKSLQDALDKFEQQGSEQGGGEGGGGGRGGRGGGGGGGRGGRNGGGNPEETKKKLEEALKKVSAIAKTATASKKDVAKAKKGGGGQRRRGGGGGSRQS